MCDYSLELYRSRQAVNDEHDTLHRFGSGTLGFIAEGDCTTAICMPAGARLRLESLDKRLQRSLRVGETEDVVMIRHPFRNHTHRDGVRMVFWEHRRWMGGRTGPMGCQFGWSDRRRASPRWPVHPFVHPAARSRADVRHSRQ